MANKAYLISWTNAHGDMNTTTRFGKQTAEFITSLFDTPGCDLVGVVMDANFK